MILSDKATQIVKYVLLWSYQAYSLKYYAEFYYRKYFRKAVEVDGKVSGVRKHDGRIGD